MPPVRQMTGFISGSPSLKMWLVTPGILPFAASKPTGSLWPGPCVSGTSPGTSYIFLRIHHSHLSNGRMTSQGTLCYQGAVCAALLSTKPMNAKSLSSTSSLAWNELPIKPLRGSVVWVWFRNFEQKKKQNTKCKCQDISFYWLLHDPFNRSYNPYITR